MKNLFALVGAGTIAFVGLGWYLDWYKLTRQPAQSGTQRISVDLNSDKITGDLKKGVERVEEIGERLRENNGKTDPPAAPAAQPTDPGPATKFFKPPSSTTSQSSANGPWKSLDNAPPAASSASAAQLQPPSR